MLPPHLTHLSKPSNLRVRVSKMNKTFPIELSENLHKQLKHAAVDEGVTLQDWILRTLAEKVGANGEPERSSTKGSANHARIKRDR